MMAHTPGPWIYSQSMQEGDYLVGTGRKIIARLWGGNEDDARLIAAAPDLLAACDEAVAALMLLPPDCLDDVAGQPSRDELINNIFSAIARARPE